MRGNSSMAEDFSIFRTFSNPDQVKELQSLLNGHGIESVVADNTSPVDITFTGGASINDKYEVRIKASDFKKAEGILEQKAEESLKDIDPNYYLFDFSNEELYDILLKADEWNKLDYALAQKILKDRGKSIDKDLIETLRKQRLEQLAKPEEGQKAWVIAGYVFSILGGFIGLVIGYFLWTAKKTLPNGQKVYTYSAKDRKNGQIIFYIGLIIFPIALLYRLLG